MDRSSADLSRVHFIDLKEPSRLVVFEVKTSSHISRETRALAEFEESFQQNDSFRDFLEAMKRSRQEEARLFRRLMAGVIFLWSVIVGIELMT